VTNSNLSNISVNVIHDMQVLGLVPSVAQHTMDFPSDSWANRGQKEESVDFTGDTGQPFQLMIPRKKKIKK